MAGRKSDFTLTKLDDLSTTLNIYTDVTKELRRSEFEGLDSYFKNEYNKAASI